MNVTSSLLEQDIWIYPDTLGHPITPTCTQITLDGVVMTRFNGTQISAQTYSGGGMRANVIADTLYLRVGNVYELLVRGACSGQTCMYGSHTVTCFNGIVVQGYGLQWTSLYSQTP